MRTKNELRKGDMFDEMFNRFVPWTWEYPTECPIYHTENENGNEFEIEVPGLSKDDIEITKNNNQLKIIGQKGNRKIERYINFSKPVNDVKAKCENGLLTVKIEHKGESENKIPIE